MNEIGNMRRILCASIFLAVVSLVGCTSRAPAPVESSTAPIRIEGPVSAPAEIPSGTARGKLHVVKKGETLYGIARQHGVAPKDLAAWNGLDSNARLLVGQNLRLEPPAAESERGGVEAQPLLLPPPPSARPLEAAPAPTPAPSPVAGEEKLKRAPKAGKLPYSEANLALLVGSANAKPQPAMAAAPEKAPPPAEQAAAKPSATAGFEWAWPASGAVIANFDDSGNGTPLKKGIDLAGKIGDPVLAAAAGKVILVSNALRGYGQMVIISHGPDWLSVYAHNSKVLVKEGQMVSRGQKIAELGDTDADRPKLHFEIRHKGKPVDPLKHLPPRS